MSDDRGALNTDRELWREREGDYYADSIHVTEGGGIGINCGGTVHVMPLKEWHSLVSRLQAAEQRVEHLENAWFVDEAINKDGSCRPDIRRTVERAEKAESDLRAAEARIQSLTELATAYRKAEEDYKCEVGKYNRQIDFAGDMGSTAGISDLGVVVAKRDLEKLKKALFKAVLGLALPEPPVAHNEGETK